MWVIFKEQAEKREREVGRLGKGKEGKGQITFGMSGKMI